MSEAEFMGTNVHMPPHKVYRNFLDSATHASLLMWALDNEQNFKASWISNEQGDQNHDLSIRASLRVSDFEPMKSLLCLRLLDFVPTMIRELRMTPFEPSGV